MSLDLVVAMDHRLVRTPDGRHYNSILRRAFWDRYLAVFDRVHMLARVGDLPSAPARAHRCDGSGVSVIPLPSYIGPGQLAARAPEVTANVARAVREHRGAAWIVRTPCAIGTLAARFLHRDGVPYAAEVIGDAFDLLGPSAAATRLRPLLRWSSFAAQRWVCRNASAAMYVTQHTLQRRYPPGCDERSTFGVSDVELPDEAFVSRPRDGAAHSPLRVLCVGSMEQPAKGQDDLVRALRLCIDRGVQMELLLGGDGRARPRVEAVAHELGVSSRVRFLGRLAAGEPVRRAMDHCDVFATASRVEGMPRVVLEAMARALPVVATSVGGIPEILPAEVLVAPNRPEDMSDQLARFASSAELRATMSRRNLEVSASFRDERLDPMRTAFLRRLRALTAGQRDRSTCER